MPKPVVKNNIDRSLVERIQTCGSTDELNSIYKDSLGFMTSENEKNDLIKFCSMKKQELFKTVNTEERAAM